MTMYSVVDYGNMVADGVRADAYARAIARAVRPGDVVLDIGCGTGVFSLLAVRAGAAMVHAVDPNPAIHLLPELARENGAEGKIVIHPKSSMEVVLPSKVDVIVSDLRGVMPLAGDHLAAIADARTRLLRPEGRMVPQRDVLRVAVVESDELWSQFARSWEAFGRLGLSAEAARAAVLNGVYPDRQAVLQQSNVLSTAATWADLDYRTSLGSYFERTVSLDVLRGGTAHGLAVWFDATIFEDIGFSTAPGWSLAYARFFLPLSQPLVLTTGARATVTLRADARGERWAWETSMTAADGTCLASYRQSTFLGTPTTPESLLRASSRFQPVLSERGRQRMNVLEAFDGTRTVGELAERLAASRASSTTRDALVREVQDLVDRFAD